MKFYDMRKLHDIGETIVRCEVTVYEGVIEDYKDTSVGVRKQ